MKKPLLVIGAIVLLAAAGAAGYFFINKEKPEGTSDKPAAGTEWKYEKAIAEPITASAGTEDVSLGDVEKDKSSVAIPKGALDAETEIKLYTPDEVPNYIGDEVDMIGSPVEVSAGKPTRLNEKAIVRFKLDRNALPADGSTSTLRVAYHNGTAWEYIKPLSIDMQTGVVTFETYHFSLFGLTKIKDETVITEKWVHSKVLDKNLKTNINSVTDEVSGKIIDLTLEKMGIDDKSLKSKILGEMLKEDGYKDIADAYGKRDVVELNQKIAILAAKKIAENVTESTLQKGLKYITDDKGVADVGAIGTAAGYVAEGQYKDAAKVIADQIIDKTIIGTAGKIAVEVVNGQINSWKDTEVEAAFTAYNHGANGVFYGYNVDKGDFDSVWDQMRGIRRQLEIEAIRKENENRSDAGMDPLTESQMDIVRDRVKESFRKQFKLRSEQEAQFEEQEKKLKMLIDAFKRANILDSTLGPSGLDKGFDYETKLDVLSHFADKIMADTKRFELSDKDGLVMNKAISVDDIARGARYWFSEPDGKKKYQQFLKDRFNISSYPALSDLAGKWTGSFTINEVIIPQELKDQAKNGKEDENGCDFNIDLKELIGKTQPITINIIPQGENNGTLEFSSKDGDPTAASFTYSEGTLTATINQKGANATITLPFEENDAMYVANGSLNMTYAEGKVKINGSMSASRPIKQTATAPADAAAKK